MNVKTESRGKFVKDGAVDREGEGELFINAECSIGNQTFGFRFL